MRISIKRDLRGRFGIPPMAAFQLKAATQGFTEGSYGAFVRETIAFANFRKFVHDSKVFDHLNVSVNTLTIGALAGVVGLIIASNRLKTKGEEIPRDVVKAMAQHFGLLTQDDKDMFDDYWPMIHEGRNFAKSEKKQIELDLDQAYQMLAETAAGRGRFADAGDSRARPVTWRRIKDSRDFTHYVVFSDIHFSNLPDERARLNYAKEENLALYLRVLEHYADEQAWCLVENGDIEECVIVETTADDGLARNRLRGSLPVDFDAADWGPFLQHRYRKRREALRDIFEALRYSYYQLIKTRFIADGERYIRLTGNHDTYSDEPFERDLLTMIQDELDGYPIYDVLRIVQPETGRISHVVMHGHQFDTVSLQHGDIKYALSCGEVFSEATAWTNEGPDRYWDAHASSGCIHRGRAFRNILAVERPGDVDLSDALALILRAASPLIPMPAPGRPARMELRNIVEWLMAHEVGWEYFEHEDPFHALGLELLTGEDAFKFRHLNEVVLTERYDRYYSQIVGRGERAPMLILGHTHEPRHNAENPDNRVVPGYMNSGSAGRFHNLIWCVEITPEGERVVSWSRVGRQLRRTVWRPVPGSQAGGGPTEAHLEPQQPTILDW